MGAYEADISRNMYDENKRYQQLVVQQGNPWVAADDNDGQQIMYDLLRRFIQLYWGDGSPDDGFKIVGDGSDNDFIITGGDGTIEGAGRMNLGGFQCFLPGNRNYAATDNLECTPVSTALSGVMLSDSAANFTLGGPDDNLVGRTLIPDITQPVYSYPIVANTQTTVTVTGPIDINQTTVGSHYRVDLSTPVGSNRTDEVYLDCYLDEISGDEDPDLKHTLAIQIETCRRLKLIQNVLVAEGGTMPAGHLDVDGNQHYTMKLVTLQRYDGQAAINPGDITDNRPLLDGNFRDLWQEIITARGNEVSLNARLEAGSGSLVDADKLDGVELSAIQSEIDSDISTHAAISSAHHTRYTDAEAIAAVIPTGTKMLFYQAAAPTGWTQDTTHNDKMLRVVSGAGGGNGGNASPISHAHTGPSHTHSGPSHTHTVSSHTHSGPSHTHTTGSHALTVNEMPSHNHSYNRYGSGSSGNLSTAAQLALISDTTGSAGGNQAHNHGNTGAAGTGQTGAGGSGNTGSGGTGNTGAGGTGNTGTYSPYYVDMIICIKN